MLEPSGELCSSGLGMLERSRHARLVCNTTRIRKRPHQLISRKNPRLQAHRRMAERGQLNGRTLTILISRTMDINSLANAQHPRQPHHREMLGSCHLVPWLCCSLLVARTAISSINLPPDTLCAHSSAPKNISTLSCLSKLWMYRTVASAPEIPKRLTTAARARNSSIHPQFRQIR